MQLAQLGEEQGRSCKLIADSNKKLKDCLKQNSSAPERCLATTFTILSTTRELPYLESKKQGRSCAVAGGQRQTLKGRAVVLSGVTEPWNEEILEYCPRCYCNSQDF